MGADRSNIQMWPIICCLGVSTCCTHSRSARIPVPVLDIPRVVPSSFLPRESHFLTLNLGIGGIE